MAKDATPDSIELKSDNFTNENHREIAGILEDEWDAEATFQELGKEYEPHRATFQNVYNRYFGVPESEFNDGIDDGRTISQLKEQYGTYGDYRDARKHDNVTTEEPHVELVRSDETPSEGEGQKQIDSDGFAKGWNMALKQAKEVGIENVPQMN